MSPNSHLKSRSDGTKSKTETVTNQETLDLFDDLEKYRIKEVDVFVSVVITRYTNQILLLIYCERFTILVTNRVSYVSHLSSIIIIIV